ncbi:helix-turn-helix transcriptional regulator [Micromonospora sp. NPDC049559]|uniref:helix-turn-helix domain-containing protein n=1 Tax=Micromonospora sp. NPDC049559 TaxID=3155923 RepID=UPI003425BB41
MLILDDRTTDSRERENLMPGPDEAGSPAEFVAALRGLKEWSGLTYRQLQRRADEAGGVLPHSTLAAVLNRSTMPREELVATFVRACGGDDAAVATWLAVRRRIAVAATRSRPDGAGPPRDEASGVPGTDAPAAAEPPPGGALPDGPAFGEPVLDGPLPAEPMPRGPALGEPALGGPVLGGPALGTAPSTIHIGAEHPGGAGTTPVGTGDAEAATEVTPTVVPPAETSTPAGAAPTGRDAGPGLDGGTGLDGGLGLDDGAGLDGYGGRSATDDGAGSGRETGATATAGATVTAGGARHRRQVRVAGDGGSALVAATARQQRWKWTGIHRYDPADEVPRPAGFRWLIPPIMYRTGWAARVLSGVLVLLLILLGVALAVRMFRGWGDEPRPGMPNDSVVEATEGPQPSSQPTTPAAKRTDSTANGPAKPSAKPTPSPTPPAAGTVGGNGGSTGQTPRHRGTGGYDPDDEYYYEEPTSTWSDPAEREACFPDNYYCGYDGPEPDNTIGYNTPGCTYPCVVITTGRP